MTMNDLSESISALEAELADLYAMSEEAARFRYNVDSKQEAIDILDEELQLLYMKSETSTFDDINWGGIDPAFNSLHDYNRMRY